MCQTGSTSTHHLLDIEAVNGTQGSCACNILRKVFGILVLTPEGFECDEREDCPWRLEVFTDECLLEECCCHVDEGQHISITDKQEWREIFVRLVRDETVAPSTVSLQLGVIQAGE